MKLILFVFLVSAFTLAHGINIQPNLVGVNATKTEEAPWIVSMQLEEGDFAFCGATVIASYQLDQPEITTTTTPPVSTTPPGDFKARCSVWILTAKSCVEDLPKSPILTLGNLNTSKTDGSNIKFYLNEAEEHYYNRMSENIDLVLINKIITSSTTDGSNAETLCEDNIPSLQYWSDHPLNEGNYSRINATVYGWGLATEDGLLQEDLHNLTIPLKIDQTCIDLYGHEVYNQSKSMICAGGIGFGPCSYDAGGPLTCHYIQNPGESQTEHTHLCGVTSFGFGCGRGDYPAVFVDVTSGDISKWIDVTICENLDITPDRCATTTPPPNSSPKPASHPLYQEYL